ncbi:MAG: MarR family transcriptional regulator [Oscillospiraceae bacterium]
MMLMSDLSIIVRGGHIYSSRRLVEYGIGAAEEYILMFLMGNSEANQDQVSRFFMLDKGSVARSLAKLESKGFIVRKVNDENQREKVLSLTEKALGLKETLSGLLVEWKKSMYEGMTEDEITAFERTAEKIAANVTKII